VYVTLPDSAGEPFRKLAEWKRVSLAAGASQRLEVPIDPLFLKIYSTAVTVGDGRPGTS